MNTIKAYFAGLFDGEGWVRVNRFERAQSVRYQLLAGVTMTHKPIIELLQFCYGGSIHHQARSTKNPNHRDTWSWNVASNVAAQFLHDVAPYSKVKKPEIELALEFQNHITTIGNSFKGKGNQQGADYENSHLYREYVYQRLMDMKKYTFDPQPALH